jgi:hypothetical protein
LLIRDEERILKGGVLALVGYFGYRVEIFRIGWSLVSLMRFLPPKCKMVT